MSRLEDLPTEDEDEDGELPPTIADHMCDRSAVRRILPLLGIPDDARLPGDSAPTDLPRSAVLAWPSKQAFPCVLPHPADTPPHYGFVVPANRGHVGMLLYQDSHGFGIPTKTKKGVRLRRRFSLGAVYASCFYRKPVLPKAPELAAWSGRLLIDAGIVEPIPVELPALPDGRHLPRVTKAYQGFIALLQAKWSFHDPEPTMFAADFGSAWCRIGGTSNFVDARTELRKLDVIRYVADWAYRLYPKSDGSLSYGKLQWPGFLYDPGERDPHHYEWSQQFMSKQKRVKFT